MAPRGEGSTPSSPHAPDRGLCRAGRPWPCDAGPAGGRGGERVRPPLPAEPAPARRRLRSPGKWVRTPAPRAPEPLGRGRTPRVASPPSPPSPQAPTRSRPRVGGPSGTRRDPEPEKRTSWPRVRTVSRTDVPLRPKGLPAHRASPRGPYRRGNRERSRKGIDEEETLGGKRVVGNLRPI